MRDLDDIDLEILQLLSQDARRPYREIADHVDLTPPAVSDRIARLEEQGIIRGFTLDIDREKLQRDVAIVAELEAKPGAVDDVYTAALELDGVEHVFEGMDGRVLVHATLPDANTRSWLESGVDLDALRGYDVTLLTRTDRRVGISATDFSLECVVCGQTVTGDGVTATVDGEIKTFCCPSCEDRYLTEYESRREAID
ncbi:winged helix-turn-helix transcriptional regulator [Halosolutus gelatinilyticus]|uniref:winged helix-turn-helix transcriptional regulator n=1 Tax=Halosolutus gelatinilyticus TaxID=2931975 RepID=UPI001FF38C2E|nr:winged helix-turn-helix transcriptional regulator [Halosolutus gelatinilyticus]